jgi:hypothetical protein
MVFPVVERVSPPLAGSAEIVGRDSGNHGGVAVFSQTEKVLIAPDVRTVVRHEDRDIADQPNSERLGRPSEPFPLPVEKELEDLGFPDSGGKIGFGLVYGLGLSLS